MFGENGLLEDVPIFVSFFVMYLVGVISVIPFLMGWLRRKNRRDDTGSITEDEARKPGKRVRVLGGKKRKKEAEGGADTADRDPAAGETAGEIPPEDAQ